MYRYVLKFIGKYFHTILTKNILNYSMFDKKVKKKKIHGPQFCDINNNNNNGIISK